MGSSTGGLLVDNALTIDKLFSETEVLIATHCEDEQIIKENFERLKKEKGTLGSLQIIHWSGMKVPVSNLLFAPSNSQKNIIHACIYFISVLKKNYSFFQQYVPLNEKRITAEVCVHHLHFTS